MLFDEDSLEGHLERSLPDTRATIVMRMTEGKSYNYDVRDYLAGRDVLQQSMYGKTEVIAEEVAVLQPGRKKFKRIA